MKKRKKKFRLYRAPWEINFKAKADVTSLVSPNIGRSQRFSEILLLRFLMEGIDLSIVNTFLITFKSEISNLLGIRELQTVFEGRIRSYLLGWNPQWKNCFYRQI